MLRVVVWRCVDANQEPWTVEPSPRMPRNNINIAMLLSGPATTFDFDVEVIHLLSAKRTKLTEENFNGYEIDALDLVRFISWSR